MTYIDPRGKVLGHVDRVVAWQHGYTPAPVTVEWDLSNRCVLGCQACHFAHTHVRGPWATHKARSLPMAYDGTGDLADAALVMKTLREMASMGVKSVVWSGGGEPTTHPQWLEVVRYASHLGIKQGMYTLGGLLTEETALALSGNAEWVVVSLDCPDAASYAASKGVPASRFEAACNGLRWLTKGRATVGASFLIDGTNWRRMGDMLELARSLGATYTTFRPAIHTRAESPGVCDDDRSWITEAEYTLDWWSHEPDVEMDVQRFREYRDWQGHGYSSCTGIRLTTTITPDGRVWTCPQHRGIQGSCLGDLRTQSFGFIWSRHPRQWADFSSCRVMCKLHPVNQQMAALSAYRPHGAFL